MKPPLKRALAALGEQVLKLLRGQLQVVRAFPPKCAGRVRERQRCRPRL